MKTLPFVPVLVALALPLTGCGEHKVVRGANDPSVDNYALTTSLDKDDMQRSLQGLLNDLRAAPIMATWRGANTTLAIAPFINETSEHIDPQLDAMLGDTEEWLVQWKTQQNAPITVISKERQLDMIREVEGQQHPIFNPAHMAQYGQQLGVQYFITGKVMSADERTEDVRRVQYFLYMQVIEVATSAIQWEKKSEITKMAM